MGFAIPKIVYGDFIPTVISFDYPPTDPTPEATKTNRKISESLSGIRQVQFNNNTGTNKLTFRFVSEALTTSLKIFYNNFASRGKAFRYYDDKLSSNYKSYEIDSEKFEPKPIAPVGVDLYVYEIELDMRRVLDDGVTEGVLQMQIANNQASPADVAGLALDSASYRSVQVFYEIWRKTSSSETVSNGYFKCFFKESTGNWSLEPGEFEGDLSGVTFSVTNAGQVQYTSDNQAGTNYDSELLMRDFTILGG